VDKEIREMPKGLRVIGALCHPASRVEVLLRRSHDLALSARRCIAVNEPLSRGAIEQLNRPLAIRAGRGWISRPLESRAKGGPLRPVANSGRAGFSHVLFGGRDLWHEYSVAR
jgi:hypothetical protein